MKKIICLIFILLAARAAFTQIYKPVQWNISLNKNEIVFAADIEDGWHIYAMTEEAGGPSPTEFSFEKVLGAELEGEVFSSSPLTEAYDKLFHTKVRWFEGKPVFIQKFKPAGAGNFALEGYIEYSACNAKRCVPLTEEFSFASRAAGGTATAGAAEEEDFWRPVSAYYASQSGAETSRAGVFFICFAGGLLALLMPCVWPVIPLTVSIFLKRSRGNIKKAAADAVFYGASILIIYLIFGLLFTLIFGAAALNGLATNAAVNLFFFFLLVLFALSFFGLFEITLPAAWAGKINGRARDSAGLTGIFFTAFTLVLVSFSCTAPIIGTLLVQLSASDEFLSPLVGMAGFGLALALPFMLFAFFPTLLKKLPKSGDWLNTLKAVLGFLELALALKFLSTADLAYHWNILNRDVFLIIWILIFTALGFYLLKKIKRAVPRLLLAAASFAFASCMIPGLWGAPLKPVSAFLPPLSTQKFKLYDVLVKPKFHDYDEGMAFARRNNKPVMLDFTGYGCVNCRKMEAAVLSDPRVKEIIDRDFVLIALYVDDRAKLPKTLEKEEYGKTIKLRTAGDKWSYLQRHKFGANAQPFYALLDNGGNPLAPWRAYDEDVAGFINYLKTGIKNYSAR